VNGCPCICRSWKDRPSALRLLEHPFLAEVVCRTVAAPLNNIANMVQEPAIKVRLGGTEHALCPIHACEESALPKSATKTYLPLSSNLHPPSDERYRMCEARL
jgi:hypothetical protein